MNVARGLERRLERLLEGVFGRVFSGKLHPSEIATRIAREADLARFDHASGPATANYITLTFHPKDMGEASPQLADSMTDSFAEYVVESGLRLVGPPHVTIKIDQDILPGQFLCHLEIVPGEERPWARLTGDDGTYQIRPNRAIIGRTTEADVVIPFDDISRSHVLIWRAEGSTWIRDLGSSNGTHVDSRRLGNEPTSIATGTNLRFSEHSVRFVEIVDPRNTP
jgi:FhaA, N-terminal domain/FHA domain